MRLGIAAAVLALSLQAPASASRPKAAQPESALSRLFNRISDYLNAEPVRKAKLSAAVAAVRGGIPTEQGEDLDQRLLDNALLLRQRLLSPSPSAEDRERLRAIYSALGVSQWVQSVELDPKGSSSAQAREALRSWAAGTRLGLPSPAKSLFLGSSPLGARSLVESGWGAYCRSLTPEISDGAAPEPGEFVADPKTARLDETLESLTRSWTEKKLPAPQEAQGHFLAGQVYAELAKAPLTAAPLPKTSVAAQPAPPAQEEALPSQAPKAQSPQAGPDFSARGIYAKAAKGVVFILCASSDGAGELGSGSAVDASGHILTNAHVVIRESTRKPWPHIHVYFKPQKMTGDPREDLVNPIAARVVAWDSGLDLALLLLDEKPKAISTITLADPQRVAIGDQVAAIGHPEQGGLWTLTAGVVSTIVADLGGVSGKGAFQTDASINRGNSGGPLLNAAGDMIGVNTLMSRKAADGLAITAVNFSVRSDVARAWLRKAGLSLPYANPSAASLAMAEPANGAGSDVPLKPQTVTESRPYVKEDVLAQEIAAMDDLEEELHEEVLKKSHANH